MAKSVEPKKATKEKKAAKVKTAALSEDRVVDSDSEGEQKTTKSPVKAVEKAKKIKTSTKKAAVPTPPPPPPKKSESSEDESDSNDVDTGDDESTASESTQTIQKKAVNGVKRKADEASDDDSGSEEDSSSGESLEEMQPAAKKAKTQTQSKTIAAPATSHSVNEEAAPAVVPLTSIPAKVFAAPKDFAPVDVSKLRSTLSSNLKGKQIWHITAPSSVPISEIAAVGLDAITNGSTVLNHKDSSYTLTEDSSTNNATFGVLLSGNEGYKLLDQPVEKTLKLQQKVELPKLGEKQASTETGSEAAADVWQVSKLDGDGVRPQPKGMKMRYKPPGFGVGDPGLGSDDDDEEVGFKLPKAKKAKKARRESGEGMDGVEMTGKELSKEDKKKAKKAAKAAAASQ